VEISSNELRQSLDVVLAQVAKPTFRWSAATHKWRPESLHFPLECRPQGIRPLNSQQCSPG